MRSLERLLLSLVLLALAVAPGLAQSGSFGNSVVIGDDELIIAEPNNHFRPGIVYVYRRSGGEWREAAQLQAPDAQRADGFGTALGLAGETLVVAQRDGALHTFRRDGAAWRPAGTLPLDRPIGLDPGCSQYGYCGTDFGVAIAGEGDWLLVGDAGSTLRSEEGDDDDHQALQGEDAGSRAGVVHAFQRGADGTWTQRARLQPAGSAAGDGFGTAIALEDGRALIGAPNRAAPGGAARAGGVFEFVLQDGAWRQVGQIPPEPEQNAQFGAAVALEDGVATVGAPGSGDARGAVLVYRRDPAAGTWSRQSRLVADDAAGGDRFGSTVALAGGDVWIGAPAPRGNETGSVYLYPGAAAGPAADSPRRIRLEDTDTRDAFGDRLVASEGLAVVTASGMHHQSGAVFVYERGPNGAWRDGVRLVSPPDALPPLLGRVRPCADGSIGPFDCEDVDLLAFVPNSMLRAPENARGVRTNDNWGWTDSETGREYALVGRNDGTAFVDITDPTNPVLVGDLPKTPGTPPSQLWRDIKVYRDHAFIVADGAGNHGMQVFDLTRLRDVADRPALFEPDAHYGRVASVHNIAINEETGFAYLVGSRGGGETCGGSLHMVDVREPLDPTFAGCFRDQHGTHDVQCVVYRGPDERYRGREICLKSNAEVFSISDVTDKANPRFVSRASHPNPAYLHQGWTSDDHRYFYMNDESDVVAGHVATTRTLVWDLSDLEDPVLVEQFMGSLPASAHNLYVEGDRMYQANYRYGLHVLDVSDPLQPREIGSFDTTPYLSGPGFSGAWSNYPFFESGTVVVTSLQEGLFLLRPRN